SYLRRCSAPACSADSASDCHRSRQQHVRFLSETAATRGRSTPQRVAAAGSFIDTTSAHDIIYLHGVVAVADKRAVVTNRKARHDYHILETVEAGLVLTGTEVKSLRGGRASLSDAFARIEQGE